MKRSFKFGVCTATELSECEGGVRVILHLLNGSNLEATVPKIAFKNGLVKFICKDGIAKVYKSDLWTKPANIYVEQ